jgi:hypothetical protein
VEESGGPPGANAIVLRNEEGLVFEVVEGRETNLSRELARRKEGNFRGEVPQAAFQVRRTGLERIEERNMSLVFYWQ